MLTSISTLAFAKEDASAAVPSVKEQSSKEITNQEIIETLKQAVKPVELKKTNDDPVVIRYEIPRHYLETSLGDASLSPNLNVSLSKEEKEEKQEDILLQAYKSAMLGQFEASLFLYKKALKNDPKNVDILFGLGSLYQKLNQYDEAKAAYKEIFAIDPKYQKAVQNYISMIALESPSNALKELAILEKANPEFSPVQAQIGMVLAGIGDYVNAEKYLKRAIELSPEIVNYRYNLAVVYDHLNSYENAIILYNQTLKFANAGESLPQSSDYIISRIEYLQRLLLKQKEDEALEKKVKFN